MTKEHRPQEQQPPHPTPPAGGPRARDAADDPESAEVADLDADADAVVGGGQCWVFGA